MPVPPPLAAVAGGLFFTVVSVLRLRASIALNAPKLGFRGDLGIDSTGLSQIFGPFAVSVPVFSPIPVSLPLPSAVEAERISEFASSARLHAPTVVSFTDISCDASSLKPNKSLWADSFSIA